MGPAMSHSGHAKRGASGCWGRTHRRRARLEGVWVGKRLALCEATSRPRRLRRSVPTLCPRGLSWSEAGAVVRRVRGAGGMEKREVGTKCRRAGTERTKVGPQRTSAISRLNLRRSLMGRRSMGSGRLRHLVKRPSPRRTVIAQLLNSQPRSVSCPHSPPLR